MSLSELLVLGLTGATEVVERVAQTWCFRSAGFLGIACEQAADLQRQQV